LETKYNLAQSRQENPHQASQFTQNCQINTRDLFSPGSIIDIDISDQAAQGEQSYLTQQCRNTYSTR
jgi:hypothetical protein